MEIGAVDFIPKPESYITTEFAAHFKQKLAAVSQAKVSPQKLPRSQAQKPSTKPAAPPETELFNAIIIGASTGGPTAIQQLLEGIQHHVSTPVFVCQHMPRNFTSVFAGRLNMLLDLTVKEAEAFEEPAPRTVYIAPGNLHMEIQNGRFQLLPPQSNDLYTPSVNRLINSAATEYGKKTLAIILTGMGSDGQTGVCRLSEAGGTIIAEAPESCVVYGMPKAAMETGCVDFQLTLDGIVHKVISLFSVN